MSDAELFIEDSPDGWPDSIDTSDAVAVIIVPRAFLEERENLDARRCALYIISQLQSPVVAKLLRIAADGIDAAGHYMEPGPGSQN